MNTNLSNTKQAQAVERLTRNIDRIHNQQGRSAFIHEYSSVVAITVHFDNAPSIEKCMATENVDEINTFCAFLEGSKFSPVAQGTCDFEGVAA
jgi:hypothetical protein